MAPTASPEPPLPVPSPTLQATAEPRPAASPTLAATVAEPSPTPLPESPTLVPTLRPLPSPTTRPTTAPTPEPTLEPPTPEPTPEATWVRTIRPTAFRAGPDQNAREFTTAPPESYAQVVERRDGFLLVDYPGDAEGRQPGLAWVKEADVAEISAPSTWRQTRAAVTLWAGPEPGAAAIGAAPAGSFFLDRRVSQDGRRLVAFPGDGAWLPPELVWVDEAALRPAPGPPRQGIPWSFPTVAERREVRMQIPYRSQLDGSVSEGANCGPASIGMVLAAFGQEVDTATLRARAEEYLGLRSPWTGFFVQNLASVVEEFGLRTERLWAGPPFLAPLPAIALRQAFHRWTADEVRQALREGKPVIPQVKFDRLPGRRDARFDGDHYVVLTGLLDEDHVLYHDALDKDGTGFDRVMSMSELLAAWRASDYPLAGFAVSR